MVVVAVCQFEPCLKNVAVSQRRADAVLSALRPGEADVVLLPEMCFTGYVFDGPDDIAPHVEDGAAGATVTWAQRWARRLKAYVIAGYPHRDAATGRCFNSVCVVDPAGHVAATYHKHFLYETDETWATPGPGFAVLDLPHLPRLGIGICMDINPHRFTAPFKAHEFARFMRAADPPPTLILLSMAWVKRDDEPFAAQSLLNYWATRLAPLLGTDVRVAICNRIGSERGTTFAGTSCVLDLRDTSLVDVLDWERPGLLLVPLDARGPPSVSSERT